MRDYTYRQLAGLAISDEEDRWLQNHWPAHKKKMTLSEVLRAEGNFPFHRIVWLAMADRPSKIFHAAFDLARSVGYSPQPEFRHKNFVPPYDVLHWLAGILGAKELVGLACHFSSEVSLATRDGFSDPATASEFLLRRRARVFDPLYASTSLVYKCSIGICARDESTIYTESWHRNQFADFMDNPLAPRHEPRPMT